MDANVLLRILGDKDSAQNALRLITGELKKFGSQEAEATADVETTSAKAKLKALGAELTRLSMREVEVEVEVDRDGSARGALGGLSRLAREAWNGIGNLLTNALASAGSMMPGFSGSVGTSGASMSFAGKMAAAAAVAIGTLLVGAIIAAVVMLGALVASLSLAVAGLTAVAVGATAAFAGVLVPAVALAVGAIARFKAESEQAGTAAFALRQTVGRLAEVFKSTLGPAADAAFRGLARGLEAIVPMLRSLGPAFTQLGRMVGGSLRALLAEFASPTWRQFFAEMAAAGGQVIPLLTGVFISLLRVVRNIATTSMPFLISGLRSVNGFMRRMAAVNMGGLVGAVSGLVSHLSDWLKLIGAISSLFLGFIRAAGPAGQELVRWLTEGVDAIREWVNSAEGQAQIKQFFADTLPLVKEMVSFFAKLAVIALQLFQALAPAITVFIVGFNKVLDVVILALGLFNKIPAAIRAWLMPVSGAVGLFGTLIGAIYDVPKVITAIVGKVKTAATSVGDAIEDGFTFIKNLPGKIGDWLEQGKEKLTWAAKMWLLGAKTIGRNVVDGVVNFVKKLPGRVMDFVRQIPERIATFAANLFEKAKTAGQKIVDGFAQAVQGLGSAIKAAFGTVGDLAGDIGDMIRDWINDNTLFGNEIHIDLPGPKNVDITLPMLARGVRNFIGGLAIVGERGPELLNLPKGADVFSNLVSRRMLGGLRGGAVGAPAMAGAAAGAHIEHHWHVVSPVGAGERDSFLEQAELRLKALGG